MINGKVIKIIEKNRKCSNACSMGQICSKQTGYANVNLIPLILRQEAAKADIDFQITGRIEFFPATVINRYFHLIQGGQGFEQCFRLGTKVSNEH